MEMIRAQSEVKVIEGDPVCDDCIQDQIVPLFHKASDHEHAWPVQWGRGALRAEDFESELGSDFLERYQKRQEEYLTLAKCRVYCKHKILAARAPSARGLPALPGPGPAALRPLHIESHRNDGVELVECGAMVTIRTMEHSTDFEQLPTCWSCSGVVFPCSGEGAWADSLDPHYCKDDDDRAAFIAEESVRGRDYQRCPNVNCDRVVLLHDGCNFIKCFCGMGFCFLCGKGQLSDDDHHWLLGKPDSCPRFGKPGDQNAIFDRLAAEVAAEEEEEEAADAAARELLAQVDAALGEEEGEVPPEVLQLEAEQRAANQAAVQRAADHVVMLVLAQEERDTAIEEEILVAQPDDEPQQLEAEIELTLERRAELDRGIRDINRRLQEIAQMRQDRNWLRFRIAMRRAVEMAIAEAAEDRN